MTTTNTIVADWDPKVVHDDPYLNSLNKNYNGYNLWTMDGLHFAGGQFLMILAAINKLSKIDSRYDFLAEMGNVVKDDLYAILSETARWQCGTISYGPRSNHFTNINRTIAWYNNPLSSHDRYVLRDINDFAFKHGCIGKSVQHLTYVRDSEFERCDDKSGIKNLQGLADFIQDLIVYLELLKETKIKLPKLEK